MRVRELAQPQFEYVLADFGEGSMVTVVYQRHPNGVWLNQSGLVKQGKEHSAKLEAAYQEFKKGQP